MTKMFEDFDPLPVDYEISGPLAVKDTKPLTDDLRHLRDAATKAGAVEVFMNAASPGILMGYIPNKYYKSPEECFSALVDVLRPEYEAIVAAGFILQLGLSLTSAAIRDRGSGESTKNGTRSRRLAIDAINAATAKVDPQRMRLHLVLGNGQAPHTSTICRSPRVFTARRAGATGRHFVRGGESAARARVDVLRIVQTSGRQDHHSRRHRQHDRVRRAPRTGGAAHCTLHAHPWQRPRDRRRRLRLRNLGVASDRRPK